MSAPDSGHVPAVTFVMPVRHHDNAPNWERLLHRLMQTVASIAAQTSASWRAVVVASAGSRIPQLPDGFELVRVNLPANANHDLISDRELFYESVQLDKGRRLLAGMLAAGRTGYFMLVDDDDFVHRGIVRFVEENFGGNGWVLRSGYIWTEGGRLLFLHPKFSKSSGTSHIVRSDLYRLPERAEVAARILVARAAVARDRPPLPDLVHQLRRERTAAGRQPTTRSGSPSTRRGRWRSSPASGPAGPRCVSSRRGRSPRSSLGC